MSWLVEKIRRRERIEKEPTEPLFESMDDKLPLFLQAATLDSLHDIWRLNSEKLIYRLGVVMGHKLRAELGERLDMEEVGTWEAVVEETPRLLETFSTKVEIPKVAKLYARIEREGCPCKKMTFSLDFCPQDVLIDGMIAGFAQRSLGDDSISCKYKACGRTSEEGLCVHELKIKEK
jgi:hypothetical protein